MECYAKSKKKNLTDNEKKKLDESIERLLNYLKEELQDFEREALLEAKKKLLEDSEEQQKTLKEHLKETVVCGETFFDQYGTYFSENEKILVLNACKYHDLGKANLIFQKMVNPERKKNLMVNNEKQIPHGYLSAVSISKKDFLKKYPEISETDFYVMITAIYYHHVRADEFDSSQIRDYCEKYYNEEAKNYFGTEKWKVYCFNRSNLLFENKSTVINTQISEEKWNKYLLVKGLLNKFDWTVSAGFENAEEKPDVDRKYLKTVIEQRWGEKLHPVQIYMRDHAGENLVVVAPTGAGKTEAALMWINGEKGFYTLPLKVSSNAIYDRIQKQYAYNDVSLLHSDSMTKYFQEAAETDGADGYERYEKAKLLAGPLTICTVDQLFKFVYKALGTEIFPATLKYSKIVLDEIQAYSPRVVASIIYGLKTITDMGGHFAIITATLPPVLKMFMEQYGLIQGQQYLMKDFAREAETLRHMAVLRKGEMDTDEIVDKGKRKKVLVICNTVSKAQKIYKELAESTDHVYLLHSRYIRKDRELLEEAIMTFSKKRDECGIWVTTQIVEASLDIDFDILYTEMCPADSLLQRMGRCNRVWRYNPIEPNVIIFDNENGIRTIYDSVLYKRSIEFLSPYENRIFTEKMKAEYIEAVYDAGEIQNTAYYRELENYLKHFAVLSPLEYSKAETDEEFRKINSITVIPDSVYENNRIIFEECTTLIKEPHIGRAIKSILNSKIISLTLSLNLFYGKYPEGVDKARIEGTNVHRANLFYEFSPVTMSGRGLLLEKQEDEVCFL